ncbi:MAG: peptidoglycan DD-metalloendopeptidase family protein [Rhodobacteraceae bacterium]|nr:peptidoglycan DD-metalloendopeptidase family protein [Paracoccaceae bacterium]MCF8515883.1 peptidoglycan DD-metalloendopeptidase family protein [Paracoccaceae bacterium]MCF8520116.1 peptidoglycan DD-metalloendopeptidase family protein [Paracoccaceae bacterium]
MLTRLEYRINTALERYFPEQRLFLKSDSETRFIRLRPVTQAVALTGGTVALAWTILATAIILMDAISAGSGRDQAQRQQVLYEQRLTSLSQDRDARADEAARAQERFNLALEQVAAMQGRLLASEDRRRELETGIDVIQNTLRRTIKERDEAREQTEAATLALASQTGTKKTDAGRAQDAMATVDILADALSSTAQERDQMEDMAERAAARADVINSEKKALMARNNEIFSKLEEAVSVSMEPLDKMFREAGMSPDELLNQVRRGYSGQGGPLTPIKLSTKGAEANADQTRANAILQGLDRMNLYRLAAFKAPFAMPVKGAFRWTSGFGYRRDPKGAGNRMHEGTDMAGAYGLPVHATAEGVVVHAGWDSGYGRLVKIKHEFGIETRYAHLSAIRVNVGDRVSRGDRIGDMGNSGRSTGTHLHYEIRIGGRAVNPMTFIKAANHVF